MDSIVEKVCVLIGVALLIVGTVTMVKTCQTEQYATERQCIEKGGTQLSNIGCVKFQPLETK